MTNPTPDYLPEDPDLEPRDDPATREVHDESVLDPDADPDLIDSAEADRLAAGVDDDAEVDEVPAGGAGADSGAVDAVQVDPDDEADVPDISETNDAPGVGTRRPE